MNSALEYLAHIRALIVSHLKIVHWTVVREETLGKSGLFRYRLSLDDGSTLEMFERFMVVGGRVEVTKYSFHWQDANGRLRKQWDNAPHHPEVSTFLHHPHDGSESTVLPHAPITAEEVLTTFL